MRISKKSIEHIIRINIIDILSHYITLHNKGHIAVALCPFHKEKNPSFTVKSNTNTYKCYGCQMRGNAIDFLIQYKSCTFLEAIQEIALIKNITLEYNTSKPDQLSSIYNTLEKYAKECHQNVYQCINYLKERSVDNKTIQKYQIGYSGIRSEINRKSLSEAGLLNKQGYLFFHHRIIFPIYNLQKRVIGFGGRTISKEQPIKYLNSMESKVFLKRENLYGLSEIRSLNSFPQELIVVEGYFDVISLSQYGYPFAVSSLGTALSIRQITLLTSQTKRVVICFDGDEAGIRATKNSFINILNCSTIDRAQFFFTILPQGNDPDSYIKTYGIDTFKSLLDKSLSLKDYFLFLIKDSSILDTLLNAKKILSYLKQSLYKIGLIQLIGTEYNLNNYELKKIFGEEKREEIVLSKVIEEKKERKTLTIFEKHCAFMVQFPQNAREELKAHFPQIIESSEKTKIFQQIANTLYKNEIYNTAELSLYYNKNKEIETIIHYFAELDLVLSKEQLQLEFAFFLRKINQMDNQYIQFIKNIIKRKL
jgi:DNA primase